MVTIDVSIEDISQLMGLKEPLSAPELDKIIAFTKSEVDSEPEGPDENGHTKIAIDIKTASRPDLWSAEGIAREARGRINLAGLPEIKFPPSKYTISVDKKLKEIRPYIAAVVAKGLVFDNFLIKQLIQTQDKVDFSFGRKRKRTSIGIYNLHMIQSPIEYTTVPRTFKFVPLQFDEEKTIDEIMEEHPKGREYRHILDSFKEVPILKSRGGVLSLPPIINSNDVGRVTEETTDILVEVTGTNHQAVIVAISLLAQNLHDRGATIETVQVDYPKEYGLGQEITPPLKPESITANVKNINRYLGTKFTKKQMKTLIEKRRHNATINGNILTIEYGPWRSDILHWVDIAEEVAIAKDYNEFEPTTANIFTPGRLPKSTESENMIREILIGTGLQEVLNYNLTDEETITGKVLRPADYVNEVVVSLKNPVTRTYGYLRPDLLPGLIRFISRNSETPTPHHIFETGESVRKNGEKVETYTSAAVVLAGADETFETAHRILDILLNLTRIDYELEVGESNFFMDGRVAEIRVQGEIVGHIGEIKLEILEVNGIEVPVSGFEIDLTKIQKYKITSFYSDTN